MIDGYTEPARNIWATRFPQCLTDFQRLFAKPMALAAGESHADTSWGAFRVLDVNLKTFPVNQYIIVKCSHGVSGLNSWINYHIRASIATMKRHSTRFEQETASDVLEIAGGRAGKRRKMEDLSDDENAVSDVSEPSSPAQRALRSTGGVSESDGQPASPSPSYSSASVQGEPNV